MKPTSVWPRSWRGPCSLVGSDAIPRVEPNRYALRADTGSDNPDQIREKHAKQCEAANNINEIYAFMYGDWTRTLIDCR